MLDYEIFPQEIDFVKEYEKYLKIFFWKKPVYNKKMLEYFKKLSYLYSKLPQYESLSRLVANDNPMWQKSFEEKIADTKNQIKQIQKNIKKFDYKKDKWFYKRKLKKYME